MRLKGSWQVSIGKNYFFTKRTKMELGQHSILGSNTYLTLYEAFFVVLLWQAILGTWTLVKLQLKLGLPSESVAWTTLV